MALIALPEVMAAGLVDPDVQLQPLMDRATVLALGPGLGQGEFGRRTFEAALRAERPLVLDADGLNWLSRLGGRRDDWILTPHPGEAGRLLGADARAIEADRFEAARAIAGRYGGVVVLKGAGTLICDGATTTVIDAGNPGLAAGGSGDVLTGVIAALVAQGFALMEAASLGACAHAHAADLAARSGERGMIARDVIAKLRSALNP